jgi:hypothetical protein
MCLNAPPPPSPWWPARRQTSPPARPSRRPRPSKTIGNIPGLLIVRHSSCCVSSRAWHRRTKIKIISAFDTLIDTILIAIVFRVRSAEERSFFHAAGSGYCRRFVLISTLFFNVSLNFGFVKRENLYSADRGGKKKVLNVCESIRDRYTYTDRRTGSTDNETTAKCNYRCIRNVQQA